MIFVSGQIPGDASGKLVEGNIGEKTAQCCKNIMAILEEAGSSIERVVKVRTCLYVTTFYDDPIDHWQVNVFLDDMANFKVRQVILWTSFSANVYVTILKIRT